MVVERSNAVLAIINQNYMCCLTGLVSFLILIDKGSKGTVNNKKGTVNNKKGTIQLYGRQI